MKGLVAVLLLLVASSLPASADNSANNWLPRCKDYMRMGDPGALQELDQTVGRVADANKCAGYVWGLADVLVAEERICTPQHATKGQVLRVVIGELDREPQRHHEWFAVLVMEALLKTWPCR